MYLYKATLKSNETGGTGALVAFLAGAAAKIGQSHELVWSLFGDLKGHRPFLYRLTAESPTKPVLISSEVRPVDRHGLWDIEARPLTLFDTLAVGDRIAWSLRVNATVKSPAPEGKKNGSRHCIVDRALRTGTRGTSAQIAERIVPEWLSPKLAAHGINCPPGDMQVQAYRKTSFGHGPYSRQPPIVLAMTDVVGHGLITDVAQLRKALTSGIGPGRAFGCGMLLVRRATEARLSAVG